MDDSGPPSPSEEALGEGRNKTDLDQQAKHRLYGSQSGKGVSQYHALEKEATPVKAAHTQDQRFIPAEMGCSTICVEQIETREAEDDDEIGHQTPPWPISIPCQ